MVPRMLKPGSGMRYGGRESKKKTLARAVKSIKSEAASKIRMRAFSRRIFLPKRSRKYQAIHISVATTIPTPRNAVQRLGPPGAKGFTFIPIRSVSESQTMNNIATYSRTRGNLSSQDRSLSIRVGGR
jgi:hypothetical protein